MNRYSILPQTNKKIYPFHIKDSSIQKSHFPREQSPKNTCLMPFRFRFVRIAFAKPQAIPP